ncbi:DUF3854 domain-containing protein [Synechococcus sp. PCC 7335]|uniref:DUF3854 domain-containing protein n=1 Tax=Synechococcus sp. (strain ATCC 29403 / PCC 7335) TaxID=91464 RepID=UPI0018DB1658|nr:DUF3854 domain-containing protein [Synechococcus sp. PCC 7335]
MDWGQFKPQNPRTSWKHPDKVIKYEAPAKQSTRALFLSLPWADGLGIAQRHELGLNYQYRLQQAVHDIYPDADALSHAQTLALVLDRHNAANSEDQDRNFWSWWLSNPKAPIVITEGAKKAGAALTAGYATISLPGVYNGYRSKDRLGNPIDPVLIPDIQAIVGNERPIILAFDEDEKPNTRRHVGIAISRFSQLLINARCHVSIAQWSPKQGKGLDDLIANQAQMPSISD